MPVLLLVLSSPRPGLPGGPPLRQEGRRPVQAYRAQYQRVLDDMGHVRLPLILDADARRGTPDLQAADANGLAVS